MKVRLKRFDTSLPLPSYEKQAAGFDFICREGATFQPKEIKVLPSNNAIEIPDGYMLMVFARSSTVKRLGLAMANGVGIIDPFFRGDENEIMLQFQNITDQPVTVRKGDRIAQGVFVKYEQAEFEDTPKLGASTRRWLNKKQRGAD